MAARRAKARRDSEDEGAPVLEGSDVVRRVPMESGGGTSVGVPRGARGRGGVATGSICAMETKAFVRRQRGRTASRTRVTSDADVTEALLHSRRRRPNRAVTHGCHASRCVSAPDEAALHPRARWEDRGKAKEGDPKPGDLADQSGRSTEEWESTLTRVLIEN